MKKDIKVKFDTALLAKDKGFNEMTYSDCWLKTLDGDIIHNSDKRNCFEHDRCEVYLLQPTHYMLQTWLRERNIITDVVAYYDEHQLPLSKDNLQKPVGYFVWDNYSDNFSVEDVVKFLDYDEAFEQALIEGLKLIK